MSKLNINIYSIKGKILGEEADTVVVPGISGDIGVETGERILTYLIKPGIIYLIKDNKTFKKLFIFNGRFIAFDNDLNITTEHDIIDVEQITLQDIHKRINNVQTKINNAINETNKNYYKSILDTENILLTSYTQNFY